jgi:hypothetical protein
MSSFYSNYFNRTDSDKSHIGYLAYRKLVLFRAESVKK